MNKKQIIKMLKKGKTYKEVEKIAIKLAYKLNPLNKKYKFLINKKYKYLIRFNVLYKEDLEKLGYNVFEVSVDDFLEKFEKKLKEKGFIYTYDCYFKPGRKEVWSISYFRAVLCVFIPEKENEKDKKNFSKLVSLEQYINLIAEKVFKISLEWEKIKEFFNSLIDKIDY